MLPPSFYFPTGKATRANYRKAWRYILRNHRNMYIKIRNDSGKALFLRYLGHSGITVPVKKNDNDYVTYKLRFPGDYITAIRYRNELYDDIDKDRITQYTTATTNADT